MRSVNKDNTPTTLLKENHMARTPKPTHSTTARGRSIAAKKMAAATKRFGIVTKDELTDIYRRLINVPEGVSETEVKMAAKAAAKAAAESHVQVSLHKGDLTWVNVGRGNKAELALA